MSESKKFVCKVHGLTIFRFYGKKRRRPYCLECTREQSRRWDHKYGRKRRRNVKYELAKACEICGYSSCMDSLHFHHKSRNDKEFPIRKLKSPERIRKEAKKCVVLCANCHIKTELGLIPSLGTGNAFSKAAKGREASKSTRSRTNRSVLICQKHGETQHVIRKRGRRECVKCRTEHVVNLRTRRKKHLIKLKGGTCWCCGVSGTIHQMMQFHHLDPTQKRFALSGSGLTKSIMAVLKEAEKCGLVCATCHGEITAGYINCPTKNPYEERKKEVTIPTPC